MAVSKKILESSQGSSFIRKMFEKGNELKALYGKENVYDFSLGNPNIEPPRAFEKELKKQIRSKAENKYGYMPNAGYPFARKAIAEYLSAIQRIRLTDKNVIMTCGAGGGLNVVLKTILNPGDEVLASTPCFMEYKFYADNHGGVLKTIKGKPDFDIDVEAVAKSLTEKTAAFIINSPNNPSGRIIPEKTIIELINVLRESEKKTGRPIYLISDEPYTKIVYDRKKVPTILDKYDHSIIVSSYSKDLSIPGERIGFIAINESADDFNNLFSCMVLCNRILGFVNAPGIMQRAVANLQGVSVDIDQYRKKRDFFCKELSRIGYDFKIPEGTFYLFPKAPGGDDVAFCEALVEERILAVPGSGFSFPGHFRIAFCASDYAIKNSIPGFEKAFIKFTK